MRTNDGKEFEQIGKLVKCSKDYARKKTKR